MKNLLSHAFRKNSLVMIFENFCAAVLAAHEESNHLALLHELDSTNFKNLDSQYLSNLGLPIPGKDNQYSSGWRPEIQKVIRSGSEDGSHLAVPPEGLSMVPPGHSWSSRFLEASSSGWRPYRRKSCNLRWTWRQTWMAWRPGWTGGYFSHPKVYVITWPTCCGCWHYRGS